jgi:hypothetical protein
MPSHVWIVRQQKRVAPSCQVGGRRVGRVAVWALLVLSGWGALSLTPVLAEPRTPKATIPADLPAGVRERVEHLYATDPRQRVEAIRSLGSLESKAAPAIPFLLAMFLDEEWADAAPSAGRTRPRDEAANALGQIGKEAVSPLVEILQNPKCDIRERLSAEQALGWIKDPRAKGALIAALKDDNDAIRGGAAWALKRMADRDAVMPLCEALSDTDSYVQRDVAGALAELADPRALEPLIEALSRKPSFACANIALALERINDPRAVNALRTAMKANLVCGREVYHALESIVDRNFDHFFPKAREIVVSPLASGDGPVPHIRVTIREDDALCFQPHPDLAHRGLDTGGLPIDLFIEPAANTVDEHSGQIDYAFLKPIGPAMLYRQYKGKALRLQAVRSGKETVRAFYHGGKLAERPSLVVELTIAPRDGEAASSKAPDLVADNPDLAGLGAAKASDEDFPKNIHMLRMTSLQDSDPERRKTARAAIAAMGSQIVVWLRANRDTLVRTNRGTFAVHMLLACGDAHIVEARPILEEIAGAPETIDRDVIRAARTALGMLKSSKSSVSSQDTGKANKPDAGDGK